jgi:hypothetical protein
MINYFPSANMMLGAIAIVIVSLMLLFSIYLLFMVSFILGKVLGMYIKENLKK